MRKNDAIKRDQARKWLRVDLAAWDRRIGDKLLQRTEGLVAKPMTWRVDPCAGRTARRNPSNYCQPTSGVCLTLWNEIDAAPESHSDPSVETEN